MSEQEKLGLGESGPAIRVSVEARGRFKGSSRLAHAIAHLLTLYEYKNVDLVTSEKTFMPHDALMSKEDLAMMQEHPIQIVEMIALDAAAMGNGVFNHRMGLTGLSIPVMIERINTLYDVIKHGDEDHQNWLAEAITAHMGGGAMPPYVPAKPKYVVPTTGEMIAGADAQAALYEGDDRQDIKTDAVNNFYAGIRFVLNAMNLNNEVPTDKVE